MNPNQKLPRLLLVDDHRDTVELMAFFLVKHGYEVIRAYSAAEARVEAARIKCEVVISDGRLPDGDGAGLMRELKTEYGMAGVFVSGSVDDCSAFEAEGFKCLVKPIDMQKLLDSIRVIGRHE